MRTRFLLVSGLFALAAAAAAAGPDVPVETVPFELTNAEIEDASQAGVAAAIARATDQSEPAWVAYLVASVPHHGSLCCGNRGCCEVERSRDGIHIDISDEDADDGAVAVLARFSGGEIDRIRVVSRDCAVSFGGRTVLWAGETEIATSLKILGDWADHPRRRIHGGAVTAIAYHRGSGATRLLETLALSSGSDDRAEEAIFWLGAARGEDGLTSLRKILSTDLDIDRHEAAIFGLAQSPVAAARDDLASLARRDERPKVRQQAIFWLAQTGDPGAADLIYEMALTDPDSEVAEHAVFALAQLPEPDGLERLARLLVQRDRPEVRQEALFWIGQTDSDEALEIVARILNE